MCKTNQIGPENDIIMQFEPILFVLPYIFFFIKPTEYTGVEQWTLVKQYIDWFLMILHNKKWFWNDYDYMHQLWSYIYYIFAKID